MDFKKADFGPGFILIANKPGEELALDRMNALVSAHGGVVSVVLGEGEGHLMLMLIGGSAELRTMVQVQLADTFLLAGGSAVYEQSTKSTKIMRHNPGEN